MEFMLTCSILMTHHNEGTDQQTGTFSSGELTILCRATAADGTTQPAVGPTNGGYLYNGYHKMVVPVQIS